MSIPNSISSSLETTTSPRTTMFHQKLSSQRVRIVYPIPSPSSLNFLEYMSDVQLLKHIKYILEMSPIEMRRFYYRSTKSWRFSTRFLFLFRFELSGAWFALFNHTPSLFRIWNIGDILINGDFNNLLKSLESMKTTILVSDGGTTLEIKDIEYTDDEHLARLRDGFTIICKTINCVKGNPAGTAIYFLAQLSTLETLISFSGS